DIIVHYGELEKGDLSRLPDKVTARVDLDRRLLIMANHTATHLLHYALRQTVGDHANQQGSVVAPERLRFDFTHNRPLTEEDLRLIEDKVNRKVLANDPLKITEESLEDARARGVTALFGEKYEERVRVIEIADYSRELCGGTHCRSTGQIGLFKIGSEEGVAAGVRRIEAFTAKGALEYVRGLEVQLAGAARKLKVPVDALAGRVEKLLSRERTLLKEIESLKSKCVELATTASGDTDAGSSNGGKAIREVSGIEVAAARCPVPDMKTIGEQIDRFRKEMGSGIALVAAEKEGGVLLGLGVTPDLAKRFPAGRLMKQVARVLGGGGGGGPDFARGKGKHPEKLEEAFRKLEEIVAGT
ncbi:MAG: DHHA1 domain-containing protein, partial [Planctomycetota bacterium]